jgi:hypothetical protein
MPMLRPTACSGRPPAEVACNRQSRDPPSAGVGRADQEPRRGPAHRHRGLAARLLGALRGAGAHALPDGARALLRCPPPRPRTALLFKAATTACFWPRVVGLAKASMDAPTSLCARGQVPAADIDTSAPFATAFLGQLRADSGWARRVFLATSARFVSFGAVTGAPRRSPARWSQARPAPGRRRSGAAWSRERADAAPQACAGSGRHTLAWACRSARDLGRRRAHVWLAMQRLHPPVRSRHAGHSPGCRRPSLTGPLGAGRPCVLAPASLGARAQAS